MKKKAPQDSTLRNVRAANKKLRAHAERLKALELALHDDWTLRARMNNVELRLLKLERQAKSK